MPRLHAHVGHVELELVREGFDEVPAEGRINRKSPVAAIPIESPVGEPAERRQTLERRREVLDGIAPVDAERRLLVRAEPLVLIVANDDEHVRRLARQDVVEMREGGLGCLVARPGHLREELRARTPTVLVRLRREVPQARAIEVAESCESFVGSAQHGAVRGPDAECDLRHAPSPLGPAAACGLLALLAYFSSQTLAMAGDPYPSVRLRAAEVMFRTVGWVITKPLS